ncbi:hypothetical protein like AT4G17670 [Hibiscus trionum]|uniref:FLZ-type domain-containing protein n=1 Tax=Hibiscus trionum TaxID=183268 RepID=A0A9W7MHT9_HIBTR|nr:hypothetical protein like AT4G17670 [Hibiscus trionum]
METSGPSRRPFFIEEDDRLAFHADMEAGYSGTHYQRVNHNRLFSSSGWVPSPRPVRFYDTRFEDVRQPHFLDSCFLCKTPLGVDRDIFMYRGDTPFCSEECRQEQIDIDEAKEKKKQLSSSMKAMRKKEQRKSTSPSKDQGYPFRTGTVAAA